MTSKEARMAKTWKRQICQRQGNGKTGSWGHSTSKCSRISSSASGHLAPWQRGVLLQSQLKKDKRKKVWPISRELKRGSQVSRESQKHCKVSHGTVAQGPCALAREEWYRPPGHLDDSLLKCCLCVAPFAQLPWWQDHCLLLPQRCALRNFIAGIMEHSQKWDGWNFRTESVPAEILVSLALHFLWASMFSSAECDY